MRTVLMPVASLAMLAGLGCGRPPAANLPAEAVSEAGAPVDTAGPRYGVGQTAAPARIAAWDIDVGPDGAGLPAGRGTAAHGAELYQQKCAMCHGPKGQGMAPVYPALIGREPRQGFPFGQDVKLVKTVGNYWSHATTLVDYVRRAMPLTAPGSLSNDDVYALAAYILAANEIIPMDAALDSAAVMAVKMPAEGRFVPDNRRGGPEIR